MKDLYLYNSLGNKKELFKPIKEGKVSMYFCGPTVYSSPHIGNFRPPVVFDTLKNVLTYIGYDVTSVSNYTDVDDKIIKRAKELSITELELSNSVIKEFEELLKAVGSTKPTYTPRPTVYMPQIIQYLKDLQDTGYAYEVDGDLYLRVKMIPNYGELSNNSIEELENGARIEVDSRKEDPIDFALWKKTTEGIKWASPWGEGRPGWHTECCVMINSLFPEQHGLIDIHGGGFDLKFPHHENEMAQAKAHNHNKLANYWIHNGFINLDKEKMSKSLGNIVLMKDVVKTYGGLAFRHFVLSSHYRAPAIFSDKSLLDSQKKVQQWESSLKKAYIKLALNDLEIPDVEMNEKVLSYLLDDLNTPNAITEIYEDNKILNNVLRQKEVDLKALQHASGVLKKDLEVLGFNFAYPVISLSDKKLFSEYYKAKDEKDFVQSDKLRQILIDKGLF